MLKRAYKQKKENKTDCSENCQVTEIQTKKRGRETLLSDEMDHHVQIYITTNLQKYGGVANTVIVHSLGIGIKCPRTNNFSRRMGPNYSYKDLSLFYITANKL